MTASKSWALIIALILAGGAVIGAVVWHQQPPEASRLAEVKTLVSPGAAPQTAPPPAKDAAREKAPAQAAEPPKFDIVRVEPTGEAVVAGKGAPDAKVALVEAGKVVAETKADPAGNFVILPPVLAPGDHDLTLRQSADGKASESHQDVAVSIPSKSGDQVVVALAEPGKPTKLLSAAPKAPPAVATAPAAPTPPEKGAPPPAKVARATPETAVALPRAIAPAGPGLAIRSAELENGSGFYASGTATPGMPIELYLNDAHLAQVTAGPDGQWSVTVKKGLTGGHYVVRADAMGAKGKVNARVEVPFDVPLAMAEAAKPEPAKSEPVKPEPAAAPPPPEPKPAPTADDAALPPSAPTPDEAAARAMPGTNEAVAQALERNTDASVPPVAPTPAEADKPSASPPEVAAETPTAKPPEMPTESQSAASSAGGPDASVPPVAPTPDEAAARSSPDTNEAVAAALQRNNDASVPPVAPTPREAAAPATGPDEATAEVPTPRPDIAAAAKVAATKAAAAQAEESRAAETKVLPAPVLTVAPPVPSQDKPAVSAAEMAVAPAKPATAPPAMTAMTPTLAPPSSANAVIDEVETARVIRGDNLWNISRTKLGLGRRYTQIYSANAAQIRDPKLIYPGQVFVVPSK